MKTKSIIGGELSIVVQGTKDDYCFEGTFIDYVSISDLSCMVLRIKGKDIVIPTSSILFFKILKFNDVELIPEECKEVN